MEKQEPSPAATAATPPQRGIRTFGRTRGKRLSARQAWLVENLLPRLSPLHEIGDWKSGAIARISNLENGPAILEIGFGAGEHLLELARENPDATIIGAEPFINGVASLLSNIVRTEDIPPRAHDNAPLQIIKPEYKNIRIWPDDVRTLLSDISYLISSIYILHPDPWPKARHAKRRLLSAGFLDELAAHLAPGGEIIIGTDHLEYYDWIVKQAAKTNLRISDLQSPISVIKTRYQKKDMFGAATTKYLTLTKN